MFIVTLLFVFVLLYKVKFAGFTGYFDDYLSLENSNAFRGIMALVIVLHHLCRQFADDGKYEIWLKPFDSPMGWLVVGMFFFFSGYGLMMGYKNKNLYLKGFLKKRLPAVLIPMLTATVLYLPFQLTIKIGNGTFGYDYLLNILLGQDFIIRNGWYVYAIIVFYVLFFVIFRFIKNTKMAITTFTISIFLYEVICFIVYNNFVWSASSICIAFGVVYAYYYEAITRIMKKLYYLLLALCIIGYIGSMAINPLFNRLFHFYPPEFISENFCCLFFVLFSLIICLKLNFNNVLTAFLGNISYEIYLLHGLFIIIFANFIKIDNSILYTALVLAFTVLSSWLIHKINRLITGKYNHYMLNTEKLK